MADSNSEREIRIAEAIAQFNDLRVREESIEINDFVLAYPDLEPELREQLDALLEIENVLEGGDQTREEIAIPGELSGYQVLCSIGSGGMGQVLLAVDKRLDRKLAIKLLTPIFWDNPVVRTRFMEEARSLASINHPNIVRIYNLGRDSEPPHFVMEHVEGAPLIEAVSGLTLRSKIVLFQKIAKAVAFLHESSIVHRDLKPGNILIQTNHEPKIVDFGLALRFQDPHRKLTLEGEILGTPAYFSPEQATPGHTVDIRSDVFSLGTILYELITGDLPFKGTSLVEQIEEIQNSEPIPPSRFNREISRDLQNICMQALEKSPDDRYQSAREFAQDVERYLTGESVVASPKSYSRIMSDRISEHLRELEQWKHDRILSDYEHDSFRKLYDRLIDREDAWIMEMRRFSLMQVILYLGAWLLVIGAFLFTLFQYQEIPRIAPILFDAGATAGTGLLGIRLWRKTDRKKAVPVLLAFCLLLPSTLILLMQETGIFTGITKGDPELELFHHFSTLRMITNSQLWWSILLSLPFYVWIRRVTRSSVFSVVLSTFMAFWCLVCLLRMGAIEWFDTDPGKPFFYLIPFAFAFLILGLILERLKLSGDSRYFYPIAVIFTLCALSGVSAFHEPYSDWLKNALPFTRGEVEYLFAINGFIYWLLQKACEQVSTAQMRRVAKAFRFFIPGHILGALLFLGINATELWHASPDDTSLRFEARFFEILLPIVSGGFIFAAIPNQMKNFLATGMLFLAIGIIRLQQDLLADWISWPISLMATGIILMLAAGGFHFLGIRFWPKMKQNYETKESN